MTRRALLAAVTVLAASLLVMAVTSRGVAWASGDSGFYIRQATAPFTFTSSPWGFRFGVPLIVWLLPVDASAGLVLVTTVALALAAAAETIRSRTWLGAAVLAVSPAAYLSLRNPHLVDAAALAAMTLSVLLVDRRRLWSAAAVMVAAVCVKETGLFLLLPFGVEALVHDRSRRLLPWVAVAAAPLGVFAVVHYTPLLWGFVPPTRSVFSLSVYRHETLPQRQAFGGTFRTFASTALIYAPTVGIWLVGFRRLRTFDRILALMAVPIVASAVLSSDVPRLMMFVTIFTVPAAVRVLQGAGWRSVGWWVAAALMPPVVLDMAASPAKVAVEAALVVLTAVSLALVVSARPTSTADSSVAGAA